MESQEVLESMRVVDASVTSCGDGSVQLSSSIKVSENLGDDLLEDLDSYLEDINDRLTISRMVSDSVIKGMVNAVAQDAAEKIAAKELEVAGLKESLHLYHVGTDKIESSGSLVTHREPRSTKHGPYSRFPDALVEHDRMAESLGNLRNEAKEQFKKLKKEIDNIRECSSIKRISSGSELLGLGGILQEKVSERWVGVDRTLDTLKTTLDTVCKRVDDLVYLSRASLCEWQQDREFQGELEAMVIRHSIRSLQEEFEEKLWDHNARFYGSQNWLEKINEISSLRQELDVILKSLSIPEIGQLTSQGSLETVFNRKVLSNPVSSSASLLEGNGKLEESKTTMLENFDSAQLKHMSKDELVNFFKTEMTKMKRNHESTEQEMTEEYFSLKRELFKERASSSALKKDKELDILRKKIPEVILKLDDILVENEKLPAFNNSSGSLGSLKDRLDALLSENRHLRDLVTDKKKEVKGLSSQVSDAAEKMSLHSLAEANLLKLTGNLKSDIEDAHIEASVSEEVFKCVFREVAGQIKCDSEEPDMESIIMQEIYGIIFREAVHNAEATIKWEIKDLDMEFIIMQGLCEVIFREAVKDAEAELNILKTKYMNENEIRVSLETKALETEKTLRQEVKEKERLKQATLSMAASMEEKEKLAVELTNALVKERERFELASQDLNNLRDRASQQDILIRALTQEQQNTLLLVEAKEREHSKQMDSIVILVHGQSKAVTDFECRVTEDIKGNSLRLENLSSQLSSLIQKANILRRTGLQYKQRLERRYSDLQKAEAEVDLLGDEVDTLLSLLEKIYIALDHYSPILQHYPGVIEILKLVRRELSGESTKPV